MSKYNVKKFTIGWIYRIQNKVNGKVYIGQTIHKETRLYEHFKKTNQRFSSAIKHYGRNIFEISYLCECYSREDLDWAEMFYIVEWYDSAHDKRGYNLRTEIQGDHFLSKLTDEEYNKYIQKMIIAQNNPLTNDK